MKYMDGFFVIMFYLIGGTVAIALVAGWLLKRFGSRK